MLSGQKHIYIYIYIFSNSKSCKKLGRVPADDSGLQDNLRILSITYMSIVTALTFFLGAMMIFESREIFMMMSKGWSFFWEIIFLVF